MHRAQPSAVFKESPLPSARVRKRDEVAKSGLFHIARGRRRTEDHRSAVSHSELRRKDAASGQVSDDRERCRGYRGYPLATITIRSSFSATRSCRNQRSRHGDSQPRANCSQARRGGDQVVDFDGRLDKRRGSMGLRSTGSSPSLHSSTAGSRSRALSRSGRSLGGIPLAALVRGDLLEPTSPP